MEARVEHFEWSADLETGREDIDDQHRHLFVLANRLQDAATAEVPDAEAVSDTIYDLTDYVVQHFNDEQELMADEGYPSVSAHRALHEHLTGEVMRFAAEYFNGEEVAAGRIAPFLAEWLKTHIRSEDLQFIRYLHEKE